jgi:hypothetical protein
MTMAETQAQYYARMAQSMENAAGFAERNGDRAAAARFREAAADHRDSLAHEQRKDAVFAPRRS